MLGSSERHFVCLCVTLLAAGCGRIGFQPLTTTTQQDGAVPINASCLDGMQNQGEEDVDCGGNCPPCGNSTSCAQLLADAPNTPSGVYQLDNDGEGPKVPFFAYCDMAGDGGGWTLAAKINGNLNTFRWGPDYWDEPTLLNPGLPDLDEFEAKLRTFNEQALSEIRVGMKFNGTTQWLVFGKTANSLLDIFSGQRSYTTLGRDAWLALLPGATAPPHCNREGLNIPADTSVDARVRIGILTNDVSGCAPPKAIFGLGIGSRNPECDAISAGNCDTTDPGPNTPVFGYIMIR